MRAARMQAQLGKLHRAGLSLPCHHAWPAMLAAAAAPRQGPANDPGPASTPAEPRVSPKTGKRDQRAIVTPDGDSTVRPPQRAPRSQRQLFGSLDAIRAGTADAVAPPPSMGKTPPRRQKRAGPPSGGRTPKNQAPDDIIIISPAPRLAQGAASAQPVRNVASTPTGATNDAGAAADEDAADGARVWRERLERVGWGYDSDEEEGEDGDEGYEDDEEEEDRDALGWGSGEAAEGLLEATPFGAWFAGEGEQPPESKEQQELRRWYTQAGYSLPVQWGNVTAAMVPGSGRGLVATRALAAGDLVLVSRAAVLLEYVPTEAGPSGAAGADGPENEELADMLMSRRCKLRAAQRLWLDELLMDTRPDTANPSPDAPQAGAAPLPGLPRLPTLQDISDLQANEGPASPLPRQDDAGKQRLYQLVNLNCLGEEFMEQAASSLRQEDTPGWLGLWPDAALINHACAPNATYWALGDRLVVRATDSIPAGKEVTLSYLGALHTAPLDVRRAELRSAWGFECSCARCKTEARAAPPGSELAAQVSELHEWCSELSEVLNAALEEGDLQEVADIRKELEARRDQFEASMRAAKLGPKARRWLQASVYDLYDLLSLCADEEGGSPAGSAVAVGQPQGKPGPVSSGAGDGLLDTEHLAVCTRILDAVARGSDAHVYLSAEYMVRAGVRFGAQHHEAQEAQRMCRTSLTARFGAVSPALLDQLVAARLDD